LFEAFLEILQFEQLLFHISSNFAIASLIFFSGLITAPIFCIAFYNNIISAILFEVLNKLLTHLQLFGIIFCLFWFFELHIFYLIPIFLVKFFAMVAQFQVSDRKQML